MTIGEKIKAFRKERKLTQAKLSELTGIAEITIRQYEAGKYKPKTEQLIKLSAALGVSVHDLAPDIYEKYTFNKQELELIDALNHFLQRDVSEKDLNVLSTFMNSQEFKELERTNKGFQTLRIRKRLDTFYAQLNLNGQIKAMTYVEDQAKIPEYRKQQPDTSEEPAASDLLAAHARTDVEQTPEGVQHDLDIMNDDENWK